MAMLLYCACILAMIVPTVRAQDPTVFLDIGTIRGKTVTYSFYQVDQYLGIPYALPPVGGLRFVETQELYDMYLGSSTYDATEYKHCCPQMTAAVEGMPPVGSENEDCLYLNVFVPKSSPDRAEGYAVMIWIHGGMFSEGSSNMFDMTHLAAMGNVIVVSLNYRLGVLGFLSTKDKSIAGNFGLHDQAMAIKWVKTNIGAFGGDVDRVTVFGESSGAMSACYQGMYPANKGMFKRIIAQSGSAFIPRVPLDKDPMPKVWALAAALNCSTYNLHTAIDCLKTASWEDIKNTMINFQYHREMKMMMKFMPVVDRDIIQMSPKELVEMMKYYVPETISFFRSLDFLNGVNVYEGVAVMYAMGMKDLNNFTPTENEFMSQHIDDMFHDHGHKMVRNTTRKLVAHEYTNWTSPMATESVRMMIVKAFGDANWVVPQSIMSMLHSDDMTSVMEKTYAYHFVPVTSQRPSFAPSWLHGATHGEELNLLFGVNYDMMQVWEKDLSDKMIQYWTNFAKTG